MQTFLCCSFPHRNYGYAAARAYNAYRDPEFLAFAVTSWGSARRYTISKEQAAAGSMDVKQFNLSTSCSGGECCRGNINYITDQFTNPRSQQL